MSRYATGAARAAVGRILRRETFDAVVADHLHAAPLVKAGPPTLRILLAHNVESVAWRRLEAAVPGWPARAAAGWLRRRIERYEADTARAFDVTLVTSEIDRSALLDLAPSARVEVYPNGVDCDRFRPGGAVAAPIPWPGPTLVYVGRMNWGPNVDASRRLVRRVLPRVRRSLPGAGVVLAGADPGRRVRALARPGRVLVTGTVADVRPWLTAGDVLAVPLRLGSGTRVKILQAMAMGVPVAATPRAAEGIRAVPGRDLVLAESEEELAGEIVALLTNEARRAALARSGRRVVERTYDLPRVGRVLDGLEAWRAASSEAAQEA
jgi:glycosyltransferase involved in cell wall biosynthesis